VIIINLHRTTILQIDVLLLQSTLYFVRACCIICNLLTDAVYHIAV